MKLKLLFISLFFCTAVSAQDFIMKKKLADRYYDRFDYHQAIPMYEQLLKSYPNNFEIHEKLADAYRRINDSEHAETYYAMIVDSADKKHEYLLYYAQTLARNNKYDKAAMWYKKYHEKEPSDIRGTTFPLAYEHLNEFFKDSTAFAIRKLLFNSTSSDFSPAYYDNGIVFASARPKFSIIHILYNWTNASYLDLFTANPEIADVSDFSRDINSIYHEGPVSFNKNQDTIIFTRSNFFHSRFRKSHEGINKLKLFQANFNKTDHRWENITPLPFNNDQYSVGHPAFGQDDKELYFTSDMPGGLGGTDIYVTQCTRDSLGHKTWSKPINLGATINSPGNEMFPFIDIDGNLWFSSNGLPGLGGLDVFVARRQNGGYTSPANPGFPFNTRFDDFGYITKNSGKDGYISSDRYNQTGDDDIFSVKRISRNLVMSVLDSKNNQYLSGATIAITPNGLQQDVKISDASGMAKLVVKPLLSYQFVVNKEKYEESKLEISQSKLEELDTLKLTLIKRLSKIKLNGKVYSADNNAVIANAKAYLMNKRDTTKIEATSDAQGIFQFDLQPEFDYIIKVSIQSSGSQCSASTIERTTRNVQNDVVFNESFPVFCVGDVIKVENIYYDLGKFNIRQDAAKELDKLLDIMNRYPKMIIELRSHTDSRGSTASNLTLSDKRAKAAAEYLYSKGITRTRIIGKGYGDTMLLNQCAKGIKCSEDEYKVNRRTEFKILSVE